MNCILFGQKNYVERLILKIDNVPFSHGYVFVHNQTSTARHSLKHKDFHLIIHEEKVVRIFTRKGKAFLRPNTENCWVLLLIRIDLDDMALLVCVFNIVNIALLIKEHSDWLKDTLILRLQFVTFNLFFHLLLIRLRVRVVLRFTLTRALHNFNFARFDLFNILRKNLAWWFLNDTWVQGALDDCGHYEVILGPKVVVKLHLRLKSGNLDLIVIGVNHNQVDVIFFVRLILDTFIIGHIHESRAALSP